MTIGPSMANIVQYYGHRKAYGLSVSPNPLHRNPSYEPVNNPDRAIRDNELQYVVWDSFSAARSSYFSSKLRATPTATTAGSSTPRCCRPARRRASGRRSRSSSSTRCGR